MATPIFKFLMLNLLFELLTIFLCFMREKTIIVKNYFVHSAFFLQNLMSFSIEREKKAESEKKFFTFFEQKLSWFENCEWKFRFVKLEQKKVVYPYWMIQAIIILKFSTDLWTSQLTKNQVQSNPKIWIINYFKFIYV
jgi:hypothetical protein